MIDISETNIKTGIAIRFGSKVIVVTQNHGLVGNQIIDIYCSNNIRYKGNYPIVNILSKDIFTYNIHADHWINRIASRIGIVGISFYSRT